MKATAIALDGPGRGQHEQGPALAEREQPDHDEHRQQHRGELAEADEEALDAVREARDTALIIAVNSGHNALADLLFDAGVEPGLHEAAAIGDGVRVRAALDRHPEQLDTYSPEGFTPLALAAHFGHLDVMRLVIDRGADVNRVATHRIAVTPLHAALFGRQVDAALLLIERGADVTLARGGSGWSAPAGRRCITRQAWASARSCSRSSIAVRIPRVQTRTEDAARCRERRKLPRHCRRSSFTRCEMMTTLLLMMVMAMAQATSQSARSCKRSIGATTLASRTAQGRSALNIFEAAATVRPRA